MGRIVCRHEPRGLSHWDLRTGPDTLAFVSNGSSTTVCNLVVIKYKLAHAIDRGIIIITTTCSREHKSNLTGVAGDADAVEWISKSRSSAHSNFAFALLDDLLERSLTESLVSGSTYRSMDVRTPDDEIESSLESGNEQSRHESVGTKRGLVSVMLNETVNVSLCAGCCSEDPLLSFLVSANRQREKNSTTNAFSKPHSKLLVDDSIGATNSSNADDSDVQKSKPLWTKLVANARADRLQPLFKPPALQRCVQTTAEQIEIEGGKTLLSATACACI